MLEFLRQALAEADAEVEVARAAWLVLPTTRNRHAHRDAVIHRWNVSEALRQEETSRKAFVGTVSAS